MKLASRSARILFFVSAVAVICLISVAAATAQCAMCRASVANNAAFAKGLNLGVAVLLVPPLAIFCSIFVIAYKHRKGGKSDLTK